MSSKAFVGWRLDPRDQEALLARFPPRYDRIVADHVTFAFDPREPTLPRERAGEVVGETDDGRGVQALVVRIGGVRSAPTAPRITSPGLSGQGVAAARATMCCARGGWLPLAEPIPIRLEPHPF